MLKPYYKEFRINVTEEGQIVRQTFEVDKSVKTVTGVMLLSDRPDLVFYRGTLRFEVNKEEIFPEGFSASRLLSSPNVKPNDRSYVIGDHSVGNGLIRLEYTDNVAGIGFSAYTVILCVEGEREDGYE